MNTMFRNVDTSIPPATAVPTECRASWPAPVANTSGSTPRMNASDVIRIGRSRSRDASIAASMTDIPASAQLLGELDDQDGVLRRKTDQHDQADLAVDVVGKPAHPLRAERAQHRERHAQQDDERQHQAFVLGRERQVDQQQRETEDQERLPAGLGLLERDAGPGVAHSLRQGRFASRSIS